MDYLLSREFDAQFPVMDAVARLIGIVFVSLEYYYWRDPDPIELSTTMNCTTKLLSERLPERVVFWFAVF